MRPDPSIGKHKRARARGSPSGQNVVFIRLKPCTDVRRGPYKALRRRITQRISQCNRLRQGAHPLSARRADVLSLRRTNIARPQPAKGELSLPFPRSARSASRRDRCRGLRRLRPPFHRAPSRSLSNACRNSSEFRRRRDSSEPLP